MSTPTNSDMERAREAAHRLNIARYGHGSTDSEIAQEILLQRAEEAERCIRVAVERGDNVIYTERAADLRRQAEEVGK